uniref:Uncharacterized protein n=1 Tax=Catagonus wagneri TaxID=51154 RepID=A0A8C3XD47_9CETA
MQAAGAKTAGVYSVQLLPIQRLGVRKGARVWETENRIPGLKLSLLVCGVCHYVCVYLCLRAYLHLCVFVCMCMCLAIHVCCSFVWYQSVVLSVCILCLRVCRCAHVYVYICICVSICTCVFWCVYLWAALPSHPPQPHHVSRPPAP